MFSLLFAASTVVNGVTYVIPTGVVVAVIFCGRALYQNHEQRQKDKANRR